MMSSLIRRIPTWMCLSVCLCCAHAADAQGTWMPDYNADGFISTSDLTGFLTAWEMQVDSVVRGSWEIQCDAMMQGLVPLDSVEFHVAAMDIQLRTDSAGIETLDTAWVDQSWMVTNIPVELNHVRFFAPTPFVTGQVSYHPEDDSYIWYMEFNESLTTNPQNNPLGALQEEGWFQGLYVFEELMPFGQSVMLTHQGDWYMGPRYTGYGEVVETWTVLDFSIRFHGTL